MPTTTISTGILKHHKSLFADVVNPRPPFEVPFVQVVDKLVMGTDFTSGDDVVIDIAEATGIKWADFKQDGGAGAFATKGCTVAIKTAGTAGYTVTALNCTGDIMYNVIAKVD